MQSVLVRLTRKMSLKSDSINVLWTMSMERDFV